MNSNLCRLAIGILPLHKNPIVGSSLFPDNFYLPVSLLAITVST